MSTVALLRSVAFVAILAARSLAAQSQFIITKGKDTIAIEAFSRDASMLTSEIYQTTGLRTQYTITLRPDSSASHVELTRQGRQGAGMGLIVHFADTLVTVAMNAAGQSEKMEVPFRGKATPFLAVSFALCEQIVQASHLATGKSATWTAFRLGAADTTTLTVTRFHADSALLAMADVQLKVALSPKGEVTGGRHVGQNWLVERKGTR